MVSVQVKIFHQRRAQCFLWNRYRQMILLFTSIPWPPFACCEQRNKLGPVVHNTTLPKLITTQRLSLLHHPGTKNHSLFTFSVSRFGKSKCIIEKTCNFFIAQKTPVNLESAQCNKMQQIPPSPKKLSISAVTFHKREAFSLTYQLSRDTGKIQYGAHTIYYVYTKVQETIPTHQ